MVNKTTKVKAHTRTSKKTGKTTAVKEHTMRYDASDIAKEALLHKKGAGNAIKARFDAAAKELASRPDPKDMSDEDVINEWENDLGKHFGTDHYTHYTERKYRNRDWSKRVNKLRKRYNEATSNVRRKKDDAKNEAYMKARDITHEYVSAYAKKVGYAKNEETGSWHFRGSHAPHPYHDVVLKAVAYRKKNPDKIKISAATESVKAVATPKKHKPLMKRGTKAWSEKYGKDPNFARDLLASEGLSFNITGKGKKGSRKK